MPRAFIIRPFGTKDDTNDNKLDFNLVQRELIDPALNKTELGGGTTGEIIDAGNIREDMFALILEADVVICDMTINNANVFYELGIRHALRKKRTILIKGVYKGDDPDISKGDRTPFDVLTDRYLAYDIDNPANSVDDLTATIKATLSSDRETDSPIFQMLPTLAEANPEMVQVVPVDFREEVERARAAGSKGWLRLLSKEVRDRRFTWGGLRVVAKSQWDLNDIAGALDSYTAIAKIYPDDIDTNLALANLYERSYRDTQKSEELESSDQSIKRVLSHSQSHKLQAEALALQGRNQKTRWRQDFESLEALEQRREQALNVSLVNAYEAYLRAFNQNLNHYYSGITALQMGTTFLELSDPELSEQDNTWKDIFDDDDEAIAYRQKMEKDIAALKTIVNASIQVQLTQLTPTDDDYDWAMTSKADILFLTNSRESRVLKKYKHSIPLDKPFVWDAAKGQLELFAKLGIRTDLANEIITTLDASFRAVSKPAGDKPLHIILFVGHRIDTPDRSYPPRFPEEKADEVKSEITRRLEKLKAEDSSLLAFASAAPGADILFHEACDSLGITSKLCLPMPYNIYSKMAFENLDRWRNRFLDLYKKRDKTENVMVLSNQDGLPRWLQGAKTNPWERGNEWVLQMAQTSNAEKISLLAVWDEKLEGDAPGGTAHMVKMTRDAGGIHVDVINVKQFLE